MGTAPQQETEATGQETVGNRLKRERLSKHLTLEEAAASTRINSKMLRALEEDDRAILPARVYVQGFIRIYAQYLGLDPQGLLEQYAIQTDQTIDSRTKINVRKVLASESMAENPAFMSSKQILILILFVLLAVLLYLGRQMYQPGGQLSSTMEQPASLAEPPAEPPAAPAPELVAPEAVPAAAPETVSEPLPETVAPPPADTAPVAVEPAAERQSYLLQAKFTERTWMWIKVDSGEPREYTFEAGQRYRWTAHDQIDLNLGNAGGVELVLNGKKIPQIGISGQVVRLKVPEATQTLLNGGDAR